MWTWDYMNGNKLAYSLSCCCACICSCLNCAYIAAYHNSYKAAAYEFPAENAELGKMPERKAEAIRTPRFFDLGVKLAYEQSWKSFLYT